MKKNMNLQLRAETIRVLASTALVHVAGGRMAQTAASECDECGPPLSGTCDPGQGTWTGDCIISTKP